MSARSLVGTVPGQVRLDTLAQARGGLTVGGPYPRGNKQLDTQPRLHWPNINKASRNWPLLCVPTATLLPPHLKSSTLHSTSQLIHRLRPPSTPDACPSERLILSSRPSFQNFACQVRDQETSLFRTDRRVEHLHHDEHQDRAGHGPQGHRNRY